MNLKEKKINFDLDWHKLSFTEYASGIEVFHASLFFIKIKIHKKKFYYMLLMNIDIVIIFIIYLKIKETL